jgi:hypothetical protein
MAINLDKVKKLLGTGLSQDVVASTVGCNPSYISQLLKDENFAKEVAELRVIELVKNKEIDDKYDGLEQKLLEKLENILQFMTKPREILQALQIVNNAKRKAQTSAIGHLGEGKTVVNLALPNIILNYYKVNIHGTLVEVGGRDLTPLNSKELLKTLEERKGANEKQPALVGEVIAESKKLPSTKLLNENSV